MGFFVVDDSCTGCLACVQNCPAHALDSRESDDSQTLMHNMAICVRCGTCWRVCPEKAIDFQFMLENAWDEVVTLRLVRCSVCKEPLYTTPFGEVLGKKLDRSVEPLCARHREEIARVARGHFTAEKNTGSEPI